MQFADWNHVSDAHKGVRDILFTTQTINGTATLGIDNLVTGVIPEPTTFGLGAIGMLGLGLARRVLARQRRAG